MAGDGSRREGSEEKRIRRELWIAGIAFTAMFVLAFLMVTVWVFVLM